MTWQTAGGGEGASRYKQRVGTTQSGDPGTAYSWVSLVSSKGVKARSAGTEGLAQQQKV